MFIEEAAGKCEVAPPEQVQCFLGCKVVTSTTARRIRPAPSRLRMCGPTQGAAQLRQTMIVGILWGLYGPVW